MKNLFAVCTPGLEKFTAQELERLGLVVPRRPDEVDGPGSNRESPDREGGVAFKGNLPEIYRANLQLRTATRILVRLGTFRATGFPELIRKAGRLPWEDFLSPQNPIAFRITCRKSRLYHSDAVAERLTTAIASRLNQSPRVEKFKDDDDSASPQLIVVRLFRDQCTISIDSSGTALYKRGYRQATAKAPLRETIAAAMLMASGWDATSPLMDPFCGSGTIPIETALISQNITPGLNRQFAFISWPNFDSTLWEQEVKKATHRQRSNLPNILASDRDAGTVRSAQANAQRAEVADAIEFSQRAISAIEPPPGPGWIVTNPPYGVRVQSDKELRNLYARFGDVLRSQCPNWHITMLCSSHRLLKNTGLNFDHQISFNNGGVRVNLVTGRVNG